MPSDMAGTRGRSDRCPSGKLLPLRPPRDGLTGRLRPDPSCEGTGAVRGNVICVTSERAPSRYDSSLKAEDPTMDSRRTDPAKQHKPVDAFHDALTVELSEEELSIV